MPEGTEYGIIPFRNPNDSGPAHFRNRITVDSMGRRCQDVAKIKALLSHVLEERLQKNIAAAGIGGTVPFIVPEDQRAPR